MAFPPRNTSMTSDLELPAELTFTHNVIEHLGIKLYKNKCGNVLAELLANSWDADATWVDVISETYGDSGTIVIQDNGSGMSFSHIRDHYLHVGKPKRTAPNQRSPKKDRRPMGRKGLGKLAPFGIARVVDVVTVCDCKVNWFTLDLSDILSKGSAGKYSPTFHERDTELGNPISSDCPNVTQRANLFVGKLVAEGRSSGTLICMSNVSTGLVLEPGQIASELGSRFTVILLRDDFCVRINGNVIDKRDALPGFEFRIPGEGFGTEIVGGKEVRYWAGFVKTAEWPADQAGVGVFAHGKIAQTRPYFFNKKGKEVFQRYLYAVVEADWIDDEDEDLISTDRTSIDWDSPRVSSLHEWGQKKVSSWITLYEDFRKRQQDLEVAEQAEKLRASGLANRYTEAENQQINKLVSDATRSIGKSKSAATAREDLIIAVSKAWINQPTRLLLGNLWSSLLAADATPSHINAVVDQLTAHSIPEKMGLALTFSQRAFALTVLYNLVHKRSETDLQKLVTEFPWILQPRGDLLTADKTLKTTIDNVATALDDENGFDPGQVIKGMSPAQRADFVFLTSSNDRTISIVEIKKPELPLTVLQERQLTAYLDFVTAQRSDADVTGVLVGNKTNFPSANDKRIVVKSWSDIFLECRSVYVELLASMLDVSEVTGDDSRIRLIREVGGPETWELLRKLSNTDDKLKDLFTVFDAQLSGAIGKATDPIQSPHAALAAV